MYCTRLAGNAGCKNSPKNRRLGTIAQLCRAISSQLRHVSTIEKKFIKQQYLLHMFSQYGELRPTIAAEIVSLVWAPQLISTAFASWLRYCSDVAQRKPTKFAWCLAVSWAGTLHIHFQGFLPRYEISPGAKFTLHPPSPALSYFGSVTARHLSNGREPNFAALSTGRHLYSAGRPSRWALTHILVLVCFCTFCCVVVVSLIISTTSKIDCLESLVGK